MGRTSFIRGTVLAMVIGLVAGGAMVWRAPAPAAQGLEPVVHRVDIRRFAFTPRHLDISVGDSVAWVNGDLVAHTATSTQTPWDTGDMANGDSQTVVFNEAGSFDYICSYHPTMHGTITVAP